MTIQIRFSGREGVYAFFHSFSNFTVEIPGAPNRLVEQASWFDGPLRISVDFGQPVRVSAVNGKDLAELISDGATFIGTSQDDVLFLSDDDEIARGQAGDDYLNGLGGENRLFGGGGNDILIGDGDRDYLDGGEGADLMVAGDFGGNDITAVVDNRGDRILASDSTGNTVLVRASLSYKLPYGVDNLTLTGTKHLSATGNSLDNTIQGNAGNNILDGRGGFNSLRGGKGLDTFIVSADFNNFSSDAIVDFSHADDRILIDHLIFRGVTGSRPNGTGALLENQFFAGFEASDAANRIIYDRPSGNLLYDPDGTGPRDSFNFATLTNRPADLSAGDFFVV